MTATRATRATSIAAALLWWISFSRTNACFLTAKSNIVAKPLGSRSTGLLVSPGDRECLFRESGRILHAHDDDPSFSSSRAGNLKGTDECSRFNDRRVFLRTAQRASAGAVASFLLPAVANAANSKSRTDGYSTQRTEREWAYVLSGQQYYVLRQGGTERPYSSVLEGEERLGTYFCAGCGTPLFGSAEKFHSGTGWPSFAAGLPGVEVENVNPVQANLVGAEIRCGTCGGHLGDVFADGKLFVGTPAFKTGRRFCVDGAALVFQPNDGGAEVFGDMPPPSNAGAGSLPGFLEPPKITPRSS